MSRSDPTNPELSEQTPEPNFKSGRVNASFKKKKNNFIGEYGRDIYVSHVNLLFGILTIENDHI